MAVQFNHTIVSSRDQRTSAAFLAEMLGLPEPAQWGPFHTGARNERLVLHGSDSQEP